MFTIPRAINRRRPARRLPDVRPLLRAEAFAHADRRHLAAVAAHADVLRFRPGDTIATAGTTARELVVVLAGEAAAVHADGRRAALPAGAEVGGVELLTRRRHASTVVAVSDVEALVVNGPAALWAHAEGAARFGRPALALPPPHPHPHPAGQTAGRDPGGERVTLPTAVPEAVGQAR